ncbi:MAG: DUF456 domain-containing protein [Bacteroidales bacterium]|nr:DUF456 domain-containing protein [Bacteroidales bacterium]
MEYVLLILTILIIFLGVVGCFLPILPGPPLSYIGLLIIHFTRFAEYKTQTLIYLAALAILVQILDYIVPIWGTKKFGGTKWGVWGSTIGLVAGIIVLPMLGIVLGPFGLLGILGGPFLGAYIGERISGQNSDKAFRAAWGSFIGFLAGTFMKFVISIVISFYYFKQVIPNIF